MSHWDAIAHQRDGWRGMGKWYHHRLQEIYRFHISPNQHVLEIGCANGNLLAALHPSRGIGIDFSEAMIQHAKANHPTLEFVHADAHDLSCINETFDVIILSDLVNDPWDVRRDLPPPACFCDKQASAKRTRCAQASPRSEATY